MDIFLERFTSQAVNYAIRSGLAITGGYAVKQCSRLLQSTPKGSERKELVELQYRLDSKIKIISPAIDMIELIAARGNTSLESAVSLTKEIRWEIQALGVRMSNAANEEELLRRNSKRARSREQNEQELKLVISDIQKLLARIEDAVPLINLAITTSGVNLTTNLPATISPSRLLQASTFLTAADTQYASHPGRRTQVGPTYTLSMYMLFAGHAYRPQDEDDIRETTWKEVIHKARVKLVRVPLERLYDLPNTSSTSNDAHLLDTIPSEGLTHEYSYQLVLIEDLDDDRVHTIEADEPQPGPVEDVPLAGIRDLIPIHEISKIFYADTGKILNIGSEGEANSPILLLKRDIYAQPPRRMMDRSESHGFEYAGDGSGGEDEHTDGSDHDVSVAESDHQKEIEAQIRRESMTTMSVDEESSEPLQYVPKHDSWRLPPDLDPEWIAFEVYNEEPDSEDEYDASTPEPKFSSRTSSSRQSSIDPLTGALSKLDLESDVPSPSPSRRAHVDGSVPRATTASNVQVKTSLSLLEMLIRLTALQQFRQSSHLTIEDELLNFFLEDSATTGAGPNAEYRQRVRRDARRRVGFDPYDESPIKRRGEEYVAHPRASPRPDDTWDYSGQYDGEARATPESIRSSVEQRSRRDSNPARSSPSPSARPRPTSTKSSPTPRTPANPRIDQNVTPSASLRSRQAMLRSQTERPKSPLGLGIKSAKADSTLGTSPSSEGVEKE